MDTDDVVLALAPWRTRHMRTAFRFLTEDGDGASTDSKVCGTPSLQPGEAWPRCGECEAPMPLFLQLDLSTIPSEVPALGEGLLQLFYCTRCGSGWEPYSAQSLVRVLRGPFEAPTGEAPELDVQLPPKRITGWEAFEDHPHPEEHPALGLTYTYDFKSAPMRTSVTCTEPLFEAKNIVTSDLAERVSEAATGDKLGGWPAWVQGVEYPACRTCDATMVLVVQIDSEDNIPWMFGDVGTGHITQCPEHRDVVAFGWACS